MMDDETVEMPTSMIRRQRVCGDCGKPLGGTLGYCYEHGGEKAGRRWWRGRKERSEMVDDGIHGEN